MQSLRRRPAALKLLVAEAFSTETAFRRAIGKQTNDADNHAFQCIDILQQLSGVYFADNTHGYIDMLLDGTDFAELAGASLPRSS